jgi:hypothetical protein
MATQTSTTSGIAIINPSASNMFFSHELPPQRVALVPHLAQLAA